MKKGLLLLVCLLSISCIRAARTPDDETPEPVRTEETAVYRLFPTQNIWTFIKLDTRNGKMWQVQFDVNGEKRFEVYLNLMPFALKSDEANGRFELYPTQNIYNFILLDRIDGRTWQVQWSAKSENRGLIPIQ